MIKTLLILYINRFKRQRGAMILMTLSIALSLITLSIISFHYSRLASPIYPEYNKECARFLVSDWSVNSGEDRYGPINVPIEDLDSKLDKAIDGVVTDKVTFTFQRSREGRINGKVRDILCREVSANIFNYLQLDFVSGEKFTYNDRDKSYIPVVISDRLSIEEFGTVESIGELIELGFSVKFRICGVFKEVTNSMNFNAELYALVTDKLQIANRSYLFLSSGELATAQLNNSLQKLAERESEESGKLTYSLTTESGIEYGLKPILRASRGISGLLYILLSVFILIPIICLHNILSGSLKYRVEELGIRRSFGANRVDIMVRLIAENIISVLVGGAVGVVISLSIIMNLYTLSLIDVVSIYLQWRMILGSLLMFLLVGILSGIIPAYRASKRTIVSSINSK